MANTFIKAEQIVNLSLGILDRELTLGALAWRNPVGDFRGAKDDTVSIRVPAYMVARERVMRSGTTLTFDELDETKVDVTLDTHVYKGVKVTDEEMTLDVVNFGIQVAQPAMQSVARKVEDKLAAEMTGATYQFTGGISSTDPYPGIVAARRMLNQAHVPFSDRFLVVGAYVEEAILASDRFTRNDSVGGAGQNALQDATIGRIAGFTVVTSPAIDPSTAIAAHRSAFILSTVTPVQPRGAADSAVASWMGLTLRQVFDYDPTTVTDRFLTDVFIGTAVTKDRGTIGVGGVFTPSEDGTATPILTRAVKLTESGS